MIGNKVKPECFSMLTSGSDDDSPNFTIPPDIAKRFELLIDENELRDNKNILKLWERVGSILDPSGTISDIIRKKVNNYGYAIISGFPIDADKPETPHTEIIEKPKGSYITEKTLIYLSSLLGRPYSYACENNGLFIHDLYPIKGNETLASGTGSEIDLEFHTEIAFDLDKPDYLLLTAVRSRKEQNIPTMLVNIKSALSSLSEEEIQLLHEKKYFIRAPFSFSNGNDIYYLRSLVNNNGREGYSFNFNRGVTYCLQAEACVLFEKMRALFNEHSFGALLMPGSALIIDNNKMLHGRALFKAQFDGKDRWLQRLYVKKNIETIKYTQ
ncbi:TauD/TfdA family dioxygenase [Rouxiella sp. Mn2063]|uniref:TauD/TfdA family dioxygenase n=1 Tax=Rouxiella sp. Mn2063 TaxID=3395262 RepID=UPI003BE9502B